MTHENPTEPIDQKQGGYESWVQTPSGERFYIGKFPTPLDAQNAADAYIHKMSGHVCDETCGHWKADR